MIQWSANPAAQTGLIIITQYLVVVKAKLLCKLKVTGSASYELSPFAGPVNPCVFALEGRYSVQAGQTIGVQRVGRALHPHQLQWLLLRSKIARVTYLLNACAQHSFSLASNMACATMAALVIWALLSALSQLPAP